ncbi:hypothetical protein PM082_020297 [Marasmius tenuissimus]|nr:hypothetical protein PM082_020297 [Marasmius tenuissimus]
MQDQENYANSSVSMVVDEESHDVTSGFFAGFRLRKEVCAKAVRKGTSYVLVLWIFFSEVSFVVVLRVEEQSREFVQTFSSILFVDIVGSK